MLFVDDEKAQVPERKEEAAAYTNHDVVGFVAQHFLVEFDPLIVGIAGVIDAHPRAEDATKPFRQLCCQDNLRQHEQNLLSLFDCLLYEMDIDFRLAATSYAVKQTDIMFLPLLLDALHCLLLSGSQGRGSPFSFILLPLNMYSFDRLCKCFENTFLAKFAQDGVRAVRFLQQSLLFDGSFEPKKTSQQSLLSRGVMQTVKCFVQTSFVVVGFSKPHTSHGLGLISATYFLLHSYSSLF